MNIGGLDQKSPMLNSSENQLLIKRGETQMAAFCVFTSYIASCLQTLKDTVSGLMTSSHSGISFLCSYSCSLDPMNKSWISGCYLEFFFGFGHPPLIKPLIKVSAYTTTIMRIALGWGRLVRIELQISLSRSNSSVKTLKSFLMATLQDWRVKLVFTLIAYIVFPVFAFRKLDKQDMN